MWTLGDAFEKTDKFRFEQERKAHTELVCDPDVCFYCHLESKQKEEAKKGLELTSEMIPASDVTDLADSHADNQSAPASSSDNQP
jgi:hypothetical protein